MRRTDSRTRRLPPSAELVGAALVSLFLVGASPAVGAPPRPEALEAYSQARVAYERGQYAAAYRQISPFISEAASFDDNTTRFTYTAGAALITCLGGFDAQARELARRAMSYRPSEQSREDQVFPDDDDEILRASDTGLGSYVDLIELSAGSLLTRSEALRLGWGGGSGRGCQIGVSATQLPSVVRLNPIRAISVPLRCTFARTCTGRLSVTGARGRNARAQVLARGDYSIGSEQVGRVRLVVTEVGRRLLAHRRSLRRIAYLQLPSPAVPSALGTPNRGEFLPVGLSAARPGECPTGGRVSVISKRGLSCDAAASVARRWLARSGYSPINAPLRNGSVVRVGAYRCVYRDGIATCTARTKRVRIRLDV